MQSIRIPLYVHIRFFKFLDDEGVALEAGTNFDYLLNATVKPGKVDNSNFGSNSNNPLVTNNTDYTEIFNRLAIIPFAGFRFQFNRVYINGRVSIIPSKKLFTDTYANYSTDSRFEESFTSFGLGVLF